MKKSIAAILATVGLFGCSSLSDKAMNDLKYGMTQEEVISIMGEPSKKFEKQWYYSDKEDLILTFAEDGTYESLETSAPDKKIKAETSSEYQKRIETIRQEERERALANPGINRGYE